MKLNEEQAKVWSELGELVLDFWTRVTDLSLPEEVAVDRAWLVYRARELNGVVDRFIKTLPEIRRNAEDAEKLRQRRSTVTALLPWMMEELNKAGMKLRVITSEVMPPGFVPPPSSGLSAREIAEIEAIAGDKDEELN